MLGEERGERKAKSSIVEAGQMQEIKLTSLSTTAARVFSESTVDSRKRVQEGALRALMRDP